MLQKYVFLLLCCCFLLSCSKFLDEMPDKSLQVPNTVAGVRSMLENDLLTVNSTPGLGPLGSDDYSWDATGWSSASPAARGAYLWQPAIYQGGIDLSWNNPYQAIYYCNQALQKLSSLSHMDTAGGVDYNTVYATGIFDRAFLLFLLQETFGEPWRPGAAASDAGIPLRLDANVMAKVVRSSVQTVYDTLYYDLRRVVSLLPLTVQPDHPNRPGRAAVYALMARMALTQQDYPLANTYADTCISLYDRLLDYNTLPVGMAYPFGLTGNPEVLFQCSSVDYGVQYDEHVRVDTALYNSYETNDLRRTLLFQPRSSGQGVSFVGSYFGSNLIFSGLALDEIYLIRAECRARAGDMTNALADLNTLLRNRYKSGTFHPYVITDRNEGLRLILAHRRKETPFRELRWSDIRRLGQDTVATVTLKRTIGDSSWILLPGDVRHTWQIPDAETQLSHIPQNPD